MPLGLRVESQASTAQAAIEVADMGRKPLAALLCLSRRIRGQVNHILGRRLFVDLQEVELRSDKYSACEARPLALHLQVEQGSRVLGCARDAWQRLKLRQISRPRCLHDPGKSVDLAGSTLH